jgi:hypothetical protein
MHAIRIPSSGIRAIAALLILLGMALPRTAGAFDFAGAGGKLGYANSEDLDGTAALSVHAEFAESGTRLHLLPNMTYWKVDGVRDLSPNLDLYYHFNPEGRVTPYLGGGLGLNFVHNVRREEGSTDLGMNLVGGLRFPGTATHYFLEGRVTASSVSQAMVMGGVTFLGH